MTLNNTGVTTDSNAATPKPQHIVMSDGALVYQLHENDNRDLENRFSMWIQGPISNKEALAAKIATLLNEHMEILDDK